MAWSVKNISYIQDKSAQLWTSLEEEEKLQALEQKEERTKSSSQDLKKKKKDMNIQHRLMSMKELKN